MDTVIQQKGKHRKYLVIISHKRFICRIYKESNQTGWRDCLLGKGPAAASLASVLGPCGGRREPNSQKLSSEHVVKHSYPL